MDISIRIKFQINAHKLHEYVICESRTTLEYFVR
jgi:hypothetical protein